MVTITPYLRFNNNCIEAMQFYNDCLGGELVLMPVGETPVARQVPAHMKDNILHASLKTEGLEIFGLNHSNVTIEKYPVVVMPVVHSPLKREQ